VIKGSLLLAHPLIGQAHQEHHQGILVLFLQVDEGNVGVQVGDIEVAKIALAVVELDYLPEPCLAAVVKIRAGELSVAQARNF
jgi:hypothetical protein